MSKDSTDELFGLSLKEVLQHVYNNGRMADKQLSEMKAGVLPWLSVDQADKAIQAHTAKAVLEARLDEVDHIPNPGYIEGGKRVEPLFDYRVKRRKELNAELQQQLKELE